MQEQYTFGLIDSHAHIQGPEYDVDREAVLARAQQAGLEMIVVIGGAGDLSSNAAAVSLAESHPALYATVGMHPHDARTVGARELDRLQDLTRHERVIAIGETGLDFYYNHSPRDVQRDIFSVFIHMARNTRLPLVVHERDAQSEAVDLLRLEGGGDVRGVIHCFTGEYEAARRYLDLGFYLSFAGIITFKNAEVLRDVVRRMPLDRMLLETDSPYLTPVPHRGKRNEPAFVRLVAETVARIKEIPVNEVAGATSANVRELFRIS
jgi:TatD DNase family protein